MTTDGSIDTGQLTTGVAKRAIDRALDYLEGKIKEKWAQHKNKSEQIFSEYIRAQSKRCSLVRTLIFDKQSSNLSDIYVPLQVRMRSGAGRLSSWAELSEHALIEIISETRDQSRSRATLAGVVSGPAGSGKSFFMRNLYIELAKSEISKIPVFIEARDLNNIGKTDVSGVIQNAFKVVGCSISLEQVSEGLKAGLFCILIDGFDELRVSIERHYAAELEQVAGEFEACPLIISGRPSHLLHSSDYLQDCELMPLDLDQISNLIERLDFNQETTSSFLALVKSELFGTHRDFLELPLLCVVMLLTYSDSGRISAKRHEFYEDALNALWGKHDARKQAGYEREKYTGLDKGEFFKLMSGFCASTYVGELFTMREREFREHLTRAKELTGVVANADDFLRDSTVSTSLMIQDGNHYRFAHRSFQEYFCAVYVLTLDDGAVGNAIDAVSARYETDSVLGFIRSIHSERFERSWVLPRLTRAMATVTKATQSFAKYKALHSGATGDLLRKVRDTYEMNPSNSPLVGAIAAWEDMNLPTSTDLNAISGSGHSKVFLRDITNMSKLHARIKSKFQARAKLNDSLFGKDAAVGPQTEEK
jgi:NACHT domain